MKIFHIFRFLISGFLLLIYLGFVNCSFAAIKNDKNSYDSESNYFDIGMKEVLSGDLIILDNDRHLCLIGIDTPEVIEGNKLQFDSKISNVPEEVLRVMGNEAKCLLEDLIGGKRIRIEFDKKKENNYGDLLGYAFVIPEKKSEREVFLNAEIIKKGYTYEIDTTPNRWYMELFKKLHAEAKKSQTSKLWQQWRR